VYLLFVEDDLAIREMMPDILGYEGIRVDLASNGAEAIAMIDKNDYAMVLMDCQMPVMDGFEASRIIRADPRFADLPIIAMTGNVMAEDRKRCLANGMTDHICKPIDWEQFFPTLARWVKPAVPALQSRDAELNPAFRHPESASVAFPAGDVSTYRQLMANWTLCLPTTALSTTSCSPGSKCFFRMTNRRNTILWPNTFLTPIILRPNLC